MKTNLKTNFKLVLNKTLPDFLLLLQILNNRRLFKKRFKKFQEKLKGLLYKQSDIHVLSGPFKGLKYIDETIWGSITTKWLGSYESELAAIVERIVKLDYDTIIDVGCAEGYYATGLAYRLPKTRVFAFDIDFISRKQLGRLARLNNLEDRITLGRYCSFEDIKERSNGKTLLISDIEGYERELLNPDKCQNLKHIDILVELHEVGNTLDVKDLIYTRFKQTHTIKQIDSTERDEWIENFTNTMPNIKVSDELLKEATNEGRSNGQSWFWMEVIAR